MFVRGRGRGNGGSAPKPSKEKKVPIETEAQAQMKEERNSLPIFSPLSVPLLLNRFSIFLINSRPFLASTTPYRSGTFFLPVSSACSRPQINERALLPLSFSMVPPESAKSHEAIRAGPVKLHCLHCCCTSKEEKGNLGRIKGTRYRCFRYPLRTCTRRFPLCCSGSPQLTPTRRPISVPNQRAISQ